MGIEDGLKNFVIAFKFIFSLLASESDFRVAGFPVLVLFSAVAA
jgi:hypothetical protein